MRQLKPSSIYLMQLDCQPFSDICCLMYRNAACENFCHNPTAPAVGTGAPALACVFVLFFWRSAFQASCYSHYAPAYATRFLSSMQLIASRSATHVARCTEALRVRKHEITV